MVVVKSVPVLRSGKRGMALAPTFSTGIFIFYRHTIPVPVLVLRDLKDKTTLEAVAQHLDAYLNIFFVT
jgi:hypothetical protein